MRSLNDIAIHEGGAAAAGAGLRVIWSRGPMWGYIGTAAVVVAGLVGDQFVRSGTLRRGLEGIAAGGAAIAGWVATEKVVYGGGKAPIPAHLMERYAAALRARELRALVPGAGAPIPLEELERVNSF